MFIDKIIGAGLDMITRQLGDDVIDNDAKKWEQQSKGLWDYPSGYWLANWNGIFWMQER